MSLRGVWLGERHRCEPCEPCGVHFFTLPYIEPAVASHTVTPSDPAALAAHVILVAPCRGYAVASIAAPPMRHPGRLFWVAVTR
jgi:hypothetical protein